MKLPRPLTRRPFTYAEATALGLTQYALRQLLDQGTIQRVAQGLYVPAAYDSTSPEAQYRIATLRCGLPSAICLLSALEHYNLTDLIPKHVWIMVPNQKRVQGGGLKLVRTRTPQWNYGIAKTSHYWITTPERTLVECLHQKRVIGSTTAIEALKIAIRKNLVTMGKVLDVAKRLGILHRVQPAIEVLAI